MRILWSKLKSYWARPAAERDLDDEIRFHLDLLAEEYSSQGMDPAAARLAARREFGGAEQIKEIYRDQRGVAGLDCVLQDGRFALRLLRKDRVFTAAAAVTLAMGIGASTAMFAVVERAVLRPLPFPHADRLVALESTRLDVGEGFTSAPGVFADWRERSHSFERMAGLAGISTRTWVGAADPRRLRVLQVSRDFFDVTGTTLLHGRTWSEAEDSPDGPLAAIVSEAFWRQSLGADARIIGDPIQLNDQIYTIIGIARSGFYLGKIRDPEILIPLQARPTARFGGPVVAVGRLRPGVALESARAEMEAIMAGIRDESASEKQTGVLLTPLGDWVVGDMRIVLMTILGAVALVWLIACANLANMQLARGAARKREFAVRASLGAGRLRLVCQTLMETTVSACVGGAAGLALAWTILRVLPALELIYVPRVDETGMSPTVLAFAAAAVLLSGLFVGIAPALQAGRANLHPGLGNGDALLGRSGDRLRALLVVSQLALSFVLLAGAGLLANSFVRVLSLDLGFERSSVVAIEPRFYQQLATPDAVRFLAELQESIAGMPGVETTALANILPLDSRMESGVDLKTDSAQETWVQAQLRPITSGYLQTLRIPILAGRDLEQGDERKWPVPTLLSQRAAQALFDKEDPVGRRLFTRFYKEFAEMEVVGVVGEVRQRGLARESPLVLYMPTGLRFAPHYVIARLSPGIPVPTAAIREVISERDPSLTAELFTMDDRFDEETAEARFYFWLLGSFALSGLLIAVVGVYGVTTYAVSRRTREFAVRLALGARPGQVLWLSARSVLWMSATGIVVGLLSASKATQLLESLLYGVASNDTTTLVAVAALLTSAAIAAAALAGRRATSIDPAAALKQD